MARRLTEQVSFRLPDALAARVRALARRRGTTQAEVMRTAIAWRLDQLERAEEDEKHGPT